MQFDEKLIYICKKKIKLSFGNLKHKDLTLLNLCKRYQKVHVNDSSSDFRKVTQGVPQDSVLVPFMFGLLINDLPCVLRHASYHVYADDVQLFIHGTLIQQLEVFI